MQKVVEADATLRANKPAGEKTESQNKEVRNRLSIKNFDRRIFEKRKNY